MSSAARKIRVLIVDDSAIVRKLITEALSSDPDIEVVGTAIDPYVARNKIKELEPDVITLDIEMPRMDGLTFLKLIMDHRPMPVIIMSSLSQRGSSTALEALRLGAVDVLGKPDGPYSTGHLGPQLIEKIKGAAIAKLRGTAIRRPSVFGTPSPAPAAPAPTPVAPVTPAIFVPSTPPPAPVVPPPVNTPTSASRLRASDPMRDPRSLIVLGASTGGTEALTEVLTHLPDDLPPIAIVQHIPPHFSRAFADRLNKLCKMEVREAKDGDMLKSGLALIAPGNFHMMLQRVDNRYRVRVVDGPMVWHQRPAVDLLFKSAAECAGANAVAGLLTGMGKDGAEGLLRLREKGAITFAQDEATSIVYGMPRAAWECGAAQRQLPLEKIADYLIRTLTSSPNSSSTPTSTAPTALNPA